MKIKITHTIIMVYTAIIAHISLVKAQINVEEMPIEKMQELMSSNALTSREPVREYEPLRGKVDLSHIFHSFEANSCSI